MSNEPLWAEQTPLRVAVIDTGNNPSVPPALLDLLVFDWLLYDRANPNSRRLVADKLPPPAKVKRFLINDQSQVLMMTSKGVFRIDLPTGGGE